MSKYSVTVQVAFEAENVEEASRELVNNMINSTWDITMMEVDTGKVFVVDPEAMAVKGVVSEAKAIRVIVRGGVVQEVVNLPDGWDFEVVDYDNCPDCDVAEDEPIEGIDAELREIGYDPDALGIRMDELARRALADSPLNW